MELNNWQQRGHLRVAQCDVERHSAYQSFLAELRRLMEGFTFVGRKFAIFLKCQYFSTEMLALAGWHQLMTVTSLHEKGTQF